MKFIKGEIYNVNQPTNYNIFMWGDNDASCYIHRQSEQFFPHGGGNFKPTDLSTVEASPIEKKWLLACKELGKSIPFKDIKEIQLYEIY